MVSAVSRPIVLILLSTMLAGTTMLSPAQVHAQNASVVIENFAFMPASMTVPVGTTVTWSNRDSVAHTTTSDTGAWDSGTLNPHASFQHTFNTPGTFTYHCMIHPYMHGTIVVQGAGTQPETAPGRTVTITPNPVLVGGKAAVQGTGFTSNSLAFVFWRRPDGTSRGVWTRISSAGTFSFVLGFAPRHGIGTELVAAFDAATRTWKPFVSVSVVPRGIGSRMLLASVNPVPRGGITVIAGQRFTPGAVVIVQWQRPDGTMAAIRVRTNGVGAFAFRLFADPRHGCGVRAFTALDLATLLAAAPFSLGEVC
jgi:plastocyanin